ncbi:hypothetical protein B0H13DRAFT_2387112 [Mycena leptocephala]|nr:hypothetical protein B0H13DRAFT_2387112 [Mycena leptocephala]
MPFEALGDDILLQVLSLCDVYTALSVSAINRFLRGVALTKHLWLSLVRDLGFRGVLDLPTANDLESCSAAELVDLIKRVVVGPTSWAPMSSARVPPSHRLTVHTGIENLVDFRLLPGGKHMVLRTREELFIYEVENSRKIWEHGGVNTWSVDLLPGGTIARVLLLPKFYAGVVHADITVHEVDLTGGQSSEALRLRLPTNGGRLARWMPSIVGDWFVCAVGHPSIFAQMLVLLVNWRAETYVILDYGECCHSDIIPAQAVLIRNHIVVTYPANAPPYQQLLTVTSLEHFGPYWAPLESLHLTHQLSGQCIPFSAHAKLEHENRPICNVTIYVKLCVFPSPLHRDGYKISVYTDDNLLYTPSRPPPSLSAQLGRVMRFGRATPAPADKHRAALLSYTLTPPIFPEKSGQWRLNTAARAVPRLYDPSLSYAGYFASWSQVRNL